MDMLLKQKLNNLPALPGVYFHKNAAGEIIYVGKAAVLKNRVRQYFQNSKKDVKTAALVAEINDTDWIVVDTEMDALFLEAEMIKRYKPKWNILLRDDKSVSYVRISLNEEVPYLTFTRNPLDDGATYVGPFYGKLAVEKATRILRKVFPYYVRPYTGKKTLDTDLGLTPGIEINKTTPKEYKRNLRKLIRYLEGNRHELLKELEKTMLEEAEKGNFELAAEARDQLFGLKELKKKIVFSDKEFLDISSDQALKELQSLLKLEKPPRRIEGYDISHQSGTNTVGSMVVFINGASARSEYRKFKVRTSTNDDLKSLVEVISRRLKHTEWDFPDLIILDGGANQVNAVLALLKPYKIPVIGRDKSGSHSKSSEVKIVLPNRDESLHNSYEREADTSEPRDDSHSHSRSSSQPQTTLNVSEERPRKDPHELCSKVNLITLSQSSHISRLIARIDEESHRFAITYHSLLKRKNMLK
ncbi:MAG: GIY-YIG nuclease family protein [Candidatus Saccharibacteria bacterium]|nr:GIY-YIG nuclease family protein [Candidatus Saccharibacteria bacterium]